MPRTTPRKKKGESNGSIALMEPPIEETQVVTEHQPEPAQPDEAPIPEAVPVAVPEPAAAPVVIEYREDPAWLDLHELSDTADNLLAVYLKLNERTKTAKKAYEAAVEDLQESVRRHKKPMPLFDGFEGNGKAQNGTLAASPMLMDAPAKGASKEAWRAVSVLRLIEFGLPAKTADALVDAGLTTIGQIGDYTAGGELLIDIEGVSAAGVENVFDAQAQLYAAITVESQDPDDPALDEPFEADESEE